MLNFRDVLAALKFKLIFLLKHFIFSVHVFCVVSVNKIWIHEISDQCVLCLFTFPELFVISDSGYGMVVTGFAL